MTGPYDIIYADPPSRFKVWDRKTGLGKSPDRHYETMPLSEMRLIPVSRWVAKDAFLIIWAFDPMLPDVFKLAEAWGFDKYVTVLFRWIKTTDDQLRLLDPTPKPGFGLGRHTRGGACEEAFLFKRGKGLKVLRHDIRREFFAPIREHSRKPDQCAKWIVDLYGDRPRLEMFARTRRSGWSWHGLETEKFRAVADRAAAE